MPITLNSSPAAVAPAGNPLEYELELDSGGVAPVVLSTGYQVYVDGNAVTEIEQIPYTGQGEKVDIAGHVRPYLATSQPTPASIVLGTEDAGFLIEYYLKYGEIEFDASDCSSDTTLETTGATKVAINSAYQWYENPAGLATGEVVILSNRPATNYVMQGASDWLWIYRKPNATDSVFVYLQQYSHTGTQVDSGTYDWVSAGAHVLSVGPGNLFGILDPEAAYYTIKIYDDTPLDNDSLVATYTFHILSRCRPNAYNDELYWVEPLGGRAGMRFDSALAGGNTASGRYEKKPGGYTDTGGISRYDVQGREQIQLSTQIPYVAGIEHYLKGLFTSSDVRLKYRLPTGSYTPVRVNIIDGQFQTLNNQEDILVTLTADFSLPINVL